MFIGPDFSPKPIETFRKQIRDRAKKLFHWNREEKFFNSIVDYPLSDDINALKKALQENVSLSDKVLTTPLHARFFTQIGVTDITLYDISPAQISKVYQESIYPMYWCDVADKLAFKTLLEQTKPSVLYLSNILEYTGAPDVKNPKEVIRNIIDTIQSSSIKHCIISSFYNQPDPRLTPALTRTGWKLKKYGQTEKLICVFSR